MIIKILVRLSPLVLAVLPFNSRAFARSQILWCLQSLL